MNYDWNAYFERMAEWDRQRALETAAMCRIRDRVMIVELVGGVLVIVAALAWAAFGFPPLCH